jgi:hypothetical protein
VLDYSLPYILVDLNGAPTLATPLDSTGAAMSSTSIVVTFDPNNPLVITANDCVRLNIDLNLAASNTINYSASPLSVTVQPIIAATLAPEDQTVYRARGIFVVAQPGSNNYIVNLRPFIDVVSALGALTVNVSDSTYYNIDGVVFTGAAGLAELAKLEVSTPIATYGTLDSFATITPSFNATAVYAGSALETPLADYVTGFVAGVDGDTLTVLNASYVSRDGIPAVYGGVSVIVGPDTLVNQDGVAVNGLTSQSISVGQQVTVAGQSTFNVNNVPSIDATEEGLVRLQPTQIWGTVNSGAAGSLSLDTLSFGYFVPRVYDFTGTGSSAANDAQPSTYAVNTGALDESATPAGTLLEAVGFVTPYGSAPPDFTASAVTLATATPQTLVVEWTGGAPAPFPSFTSDSIVIGIDSSLVSTTTPPYVATGPQKFLLKSLSTNPTIVFATGVPLTLTVGNDTAVDVFNSGAGFAKQLTSTLNGTNTVYRLAAVGQYSVATNTFTATSVTVNLQE